MKDKATAVRLSKADRERWAALARERGMTLSDLIRASVEAFTTGEVGHPFSRSCILRVKHRPGIPCSFCGGSRP